MLILHGLASALSEAGLALLLVPESGQIAGDPSSGAAPLLLRQAMVDALILCSLAPDDPAVAAAQERKVPLVTVGNPRLPRVPTVGVDNRTSAALAAAHLQSLGHRRLAVLTAGPSPGAGRMRPGFRDRPSGFIDALVGLDRSDVAVCVAAENSRPAGAEAVHELLAQPAATRPSAVFAVTDILALGALDAAAALGIQVPGQLSIIGYDDIPDAATSHPPLTTIHQDLFEQGRAAKLWLAQSGRSPAVARCAPRMVAEIVVRASTARPPRASRG